MKDRSQEICAESYSSVHGHQGGLLLGGVIHIGKRYMPPPISELSQMLNSVFSFNIFGWWRSVSSIGLHYSRQLDWPILRPNTWTFRHIVLTRLIAKPSSWRIFTYWPISFLNKFWSSSRRSWNGDKNGSVFFFMSKIGPGAQWLACADDAHFSCQRGATMSRHSFAFIAKVSSNCYLFDDDIFPSATIGCYSPRHPVQCSQASIAVLAYLWSVPHSLTRSESLNHNVRTENDLERRLALVGLTSRHERQKDLFRWIKVVSVVLFWQLVIGPERLKRNDDYSYRSWECATDASYRMQFLFIIPIRSILPAGIKLLMGPWVCIRDQPWKAIWEE